MPSPHGGGDVSRADPRALSWVAVFAVGFFAESRAFSIRNESEMADVETGNDSRLKGKRIASLLFAVCSILILYLVFADTAWFFNFPDIYRLHSDDAAERRRAIDNLGQRKSPLGARYLMRLFVRPPIQARIQSRIQPMESVDEDGLFADFDMGSVSSMIEFLKRWRVSEVRHVLATLSTVGPAGMRRVAREQKSWTPSERSILIQLIARLDDERLGFVWLLEQMKEDENLQVASFAHYTLESWKEEFQLWFEDRAVRLGKESL